MLNAAANKATSEGDDVPAVLGLNGAQPAAMSASDKSGAVELGLKLPSGRFANNRA